MKDARSRLIVALDLPGRAEALDAVGKLAGRVGCFKLGLEIFVREGPGLVEEVLARGEQVFLDLKLHDIPNTVAGAVRSAGSLGVHMLTVHASGGRRMLEAARDAAAALSSPPLLLAVTALTSLTEEETRSIGIALPVAAWVERLAAIACDAGLGGLVASPLEVAHLRRQFRDRLRIVTPGIRMAGAEAQDQSRTAEPGQAILAGSDYLVVGRPILRASDPRAAADIIVRQIEEALRADPPSRSD
jgi:orotidine-5'-phosphate decarboxylase